MYEEMTATQEVESTIPSALNPSIVFDALADRMGADNGISARELVFKLLGIYSKNGERHLRTVIEALRKDGHPICAHPTTGYYIAATDQEIDATCLFLYARAMTSLKQVAALKRVALPDFRGQLNLPIDEEIGAPEGRSETNLATRLTRAAEVIDRRGNQ